MTTSVIELKYQISASGLRSCCATLEPLPYIEVVVYHPIYFFNYLGTAFATSGEFDLLATCLMNGCTSKYDRYNRTQKYTCSQFVANMFSARCGRTCFLYLWRIMYIYIFYCIFMYYVPHAVLCVICSNKKRLKCRSTAQSSFKFMCYFCVISLEIPCNLMKC